MINDKSILQIAKENICLIFLQFVWEISNRNDTNNILKSYVLQVERSLKILRDHNYTGESKY
jgi:hypothetical protein